MKLIVKTLALFFVLSLFFAAGFYFFGDQTERVFSRERCVTWFADQKDIAWIFGILLLVSDILLPIPATGIMAALGSVYGLMVGTLIGFAGSVLAGITGYGTARFLGKKAALVLATQEELLRFKSFFDAFGAYAIIISRVMPILPEVITVLAGFSNMRFRRFFFSLAAGTLPVALLFTWMGTGNAFGGTFGMILAVAVPVLIWPVVAKFTRI